MTAFSARQILSLAGRAIYRPQCHLRRSVLGMAQTQAAEDINAAGGSDGEKLSWFREMMPASPSRLLAVANRLVDQDKVNAVVGHFCSSSTMPASEVVQRRGNHRHHARLHQPADYRARHERYVPHVRAAMTSRVRSPAISLSTS
ncbi:ABC transporter substrate-binding protein [Enterobacter cloacae subsp. cloacae]|nr:ABC transporter substrate-binding protein [Enterobacter cloacae subsp. cloacae]